MDKERLVEHEEGFSEKQLDLDVELKAGEWKNLSKNPYSKPKKKRKLGS